VLRLACVLAVLVAAAGLAACSGGSRPQPSAPASTEAPSLAPSAPAPATSTTGPRGGTGGFTYVAESTTKVCALTGAPTPAEVNQSEPARRFGLESADRGYSFTFDGNVWYVFGDSRPTRFFPIGSLRRNAATRYPSVPTELDNDALAYAAPTPPGVCPTLNFIPQATGAVGAFTSPSVTLDGQGVSLRTNETPVAGISEDGHMYVEFATGNRCDLPSPPASLGCTGAAGGFGESTESVMGVLADQSTLRFTGLYVLSAPSTPYGNDAKFVMVAMQQAADGYVYIWGTGGGSSVRHSPPYLARVPAGQIASLSAITYYEGSGAGGVPMWGGQQSAAVPLFNDSPNCMGELGVEHNDALGVWMMLYNCLDDTPAHPRGIWMRTAPEPWGPWSPPQTIFQASTDGYCVIMDKPTCPAPYNGGTGGEYGPYFIAGWTTGTPATAGAGATTTIYYTIDTFVPYGQVIEKSTITGPPSA
jgi:Domain of unknown function (DUF4185)